MTELEALLYNEVLAVLKKTEPRMANHSSCATNVAIGIAPAVGAYVNKVLNAFSKSLAEIEAD